MQGAPTGQTSSLISFVNSTPLPRNVLTVAANVVAHQVQLVVGVAVRGMGGELGGREGEDQPTAARVDPAELEHITKERPVGIGVAGENDGVNAGDHHLASLNRCAQRLSA